MTRISYAASLALSATILASSALPAAAATESVLWSFKSGDWGYPLGQLLLKNGSLFGTGYGTSPGYGQVFELTGSGGSWSETQPLKFNNTDGAHPEAGLIRDSTGTFYGTTPLGDAHGKGSVFKLWYSGGVWSEATVWAFGGAGDGAGAICDLIMDSSRALYGTTYGGGASPTQQSSAPTTPPPAPQDVVNTAPAPQPTTVAQTPPPARFETPPDAEQTGYSYIVGLDQLGDNWLALRSEPSLTEGVRLAKMGPDTLFKEFGRQGDWVHIHLPSGQIGWANSRFIACCRKK